jgi:transcriptional regulator with XRE-family HTH domain
VSTPANRLSRVLAERAWSDAELATRAGLSRAHVNRLKNRRIRPSLRDALLVARALGLEVEALFAPSSSAARARRRRTPGCGAAGGP